MDYNEKIRIYNKQKQIYDDQVAINKDMNNRIALLQSDIENYDEQLIKLEDFLQRINTQILPRIEAHKSQIKKISENYDDFKGKIRQDFDNIQYTNVINEYTSLLNLIGMQDLNGIRGCVETAIKRLKDSKNLANSDINKFSNSIVSVSEPIWPIS